MLSKLIAFTLHQTILVRGKQNTTVTLSSLSLMKTDNSANTKEDICG